MIVLALDLSLSSTGYAVGQVTDGQVKVIEKGHVNNKLFAKQSQGFRLHKIAQALKAIFKKYKIDAVVREKGFTKGHISTQALFKVAGVADLLSYSYGHDKMDEYTVTTIKKAVTGNGKADKQEVADALETHVGALKYATDDESDAVAVLVTYCMDKGLIRDY